MNILFLTLQNITQVKENGIYTDLIRELNNNKINVYVVSPYQKREGKETILLDTENKYLNILKVKTGNITKTSSNVEKGISTLTIEYRYLRAIKKYYKNIRFDMVLYSTPPITFSKIIKYFKKKYNTINYLILKDIFPQNAVDLEMIKEDSIIYRYFRKNEIKLYNNSDHIGCMSEGNIEYLLEKNDYLENEKVEIFPNSISIRDIDFTKRNRLKLEKYGIKNETVFLYGGNLGKPQGIDFLLEAISEFDKVDNAFLLIVGSGTEYNRISKHIEGLKNNKVKLISKLPKTEYDELILNVDVGLVFLDERFTIPNFPSRITSYLENSLPILAATDPNTDLKDYILKNNWGYWVRSSDIKRFMEKVELLTKNSELRINMGKNGRETLEKRFNVLDNVETLIRHIDRKDGL